jgi:hypothetical protein
MGHEMSLKASIILTSAFTVAGFGAGAYFDRQAENMLKNFPEQAVKNRPEYSKSVTACLAKWEPPLSQPAKPSAKLLSRFSKSHKGVAATVDRLPAQNKPSATYIANCNRIALAFTRPQAIAESVEIKKDQQHEKMAYIFACAALTIGFVNGVRLGSKQGNLPPTKRPDLDPPLGLPDLPDLPDPQNPTLPSSHF